MTEAEMQDQYDRIMQACVEAKCGLPESHRRVYTMGGTGFNVEDGTITGPASEDAVRLRSALEGQGFTFKPWPVAPTA